MENTITLSDGRKVYLKDYVTAKTKDLIEYGYGKLTENEVRIEVEKILTGDLSSLTIIGHFCKDDILL